LGKLMHTSSQSRLQHLKAEDTCTGSSITPMPSQLHAMPCIQTCSIRILGPYLLPTISSTCTKVVSK